MIKNLNIVFLFASKHKFSLIFTKIYAMTPTYFKYDVICALVYYNTLYLHIYGGLDLLMSWQCIICKHAAYIFCWFYVIIERDKVITLYIYTCKIICLLFF